VPAETAAWPRVAIAISHAGADGALVDALLAGGIDGIVVAGTGNGSIHSELQAALQRAADQGVAVLRVSRCAYGGIAGSAPSPFEALPTLSAVQARIELMLRLLTPG
jgi:L-asparaginase